MAVFVITNAPLPKEEPKEEVVEITEEQPKRKGRKPKS